MNFLHYNYNNYDVREYEEHWSYMKSLGQYGQSYIRYRY